MKTARLAKLIGLLIALVIALTFPLVFSDPTITIIAVFTLIYATAAIAWNLFSGFTGYISLGQAVYFGFGAYTFGILSSDWPNMGDYNTFWLLVPAGLVAALAAIPLGLIALRTRRHVFVVFTIAMLFIMQLLASNLAFLTSGEKGIYTPVPSWNNAFFNIPFYYVGLGLLLLAFGTSWWVRNSKFGLGLLAIRDDEERARGLGVQTGAYKLVAYILSAFFLGVVGSLFIYFLGTLVKPAVAFDPSIDVTIALMAFLGGVGTISGPLIGALLLVPIGQYMIIQLNTPGLELIFYGALLLLVVLLLPEGLLPSLRRLWIKFKVTRSQAASKSEEKAPLVESVTGGKG